jgi:hypothetical protein
MYLKMNERNAISGWKEEETKRKKNDGIISHLRHCLGSHAALCLVLNSHHYHHHHHHPREEQKKNETK